MLVSLCVMVTVVAVKTASHPASHRAPIEMREVVPRSGKVWAKVALAGRPLKGSVPVWEERMVPPSGICTEMGLVVGCMFCKRGWFTVKK